MTLTDWLPARRRKGTAHQLCNFDLVEIAEALLAALRAVAAVELTHVNSHTPAPPASAPPRARALWMGNAAADAAATAALAGASPAAAAPAADAAAPAADATAP
ncbi:MAG: hypothetical protein EBU46_19900 [Nitrosomonadaceae bacterium]|nr:hypothetical protein [Nitrosomonadaceae bacterium]